MKFDICVGNPPYGSGRSEIHLQIFKTTLDFCKNQMCFIMPSKPITQQLKKKWMDVFTGAVCTDIDVVDKSVFKDTNMDDTAIYYCDRSANPDDYCKKLDVNDKIYYSFDNDGHRLFIDKLGNFCKMIYDCIDNLQMKVFIIWRISNTNIKLHTIKITIKKLRS